MSNLTQLNNSDDAHAAALIAPLIERAPDVAQKVAKKRPFIDIAALSAAIQTELMRLDDKRRIELFRAHPELAPEKPFEMTHESQREQALLNLTSDTNRYRERLDNLNAQYRDKFGFPFITALARHQDIDSVLHEFETRMSGDIRSEIDNAINQVVTVCASRVQTMFGVGGDAALTPIEAHTNE